MLTEEHTVQKRLRTFAMIFFLVATYSLVIKFVTPIAFSIAEHGKTGLWKQPPILWDFWWVVHVWIGVWLWFRHPLVWISGVIVSILEILIITTKFAVFIPSPEFTLWKVSWFINKCFVLPLCVLFLIQLLGPRTRAFLRG